MRVDIPQEFQLPVQPHRIFNRELARPGLAYSVLVTPLPFAMTLGCIHTISTGGRKKYDAHPVRRLNTLSWS